MHLVTSIDADQMIIVTDITMQVEEILVYDDKFFAELNTKPASVGNVLTVSCQNVTYLSNHEVITQA